MKTAIRKTAIILAWLAIWQGISFWINNDIYFVGPIEIIKKLVSLADESLFYSSVFSSYARIVAGFVIAYVLAYVFAFASYKIHFLKELLSPFVSFIKSVPVASVVVVLLIWFGTNLLSFYVTFMVVFPCIYLNVLEGLENTDKQMLEMAKAFKMTKYNQYRYILKASVYDNLIGSVKVAVGMSFKSGVAAELIGLQPFSLGERIYSSKIYLDTAGVFAWTFVTIVLSAITEKIIVYVLNYMHIRSFGVKIQSAMKLEKRLKKKPLIKACNVQIDDLTLGYNDKAIIKDFSYKFEKGKIYCIMGESGRGKTTLLNAIGDAFPDSGRLFQENRLCDMITGLGNIMLIKPVYTPNEIVWYFTKAGLGDCYTEPVFIYSGGMKRRVALLRALLCDSDIVLLDEPFSGLDDAVKRKMSEIIMELQNEKCIIVTTHYKEDADILKAEILNL